MTRKILQGGGGTLCVFLLIMKVITVIDEGLNHYGNRWRARTKKALLFSQFSTPPAVTNLPVNLVATRETLARILSMPIFSNAQISFPPTCFFGRFFLTKLSKKFCTKPTMISVVGIIHHCGFGSRVQTWSRRISIERIAGDSFKIEPPNMEILKLRC